MCGREAVLTVELQMTDQTVEKLHVDIDTVQSYAAHVETNEARIISCC